MEVSVDTDRAKLVVKRVDEAFNRREGLLQEIGDLVESQIPDGVSPLSKDHALFLFYTVVNDHGMKSTRLYSGAKKLFLSNRELFDPVAVLRDFSSGSDARLVKMTGQNLGTRYPKETARIWFLNSERLVQKFDGDPRNLFISTDQARTLLKEIKAFRGYGPKIGGMLLRAVIGLGFADVEGVEEVLVPVDIHDSRISFLTGILRAKDVSDTKIDYYAYVKTVQKVLLDACNSAGMKWLDTDRALWLIGSRGCVKKRCSLCPLHDICEIGLEVVQNQTERSSRGRRDEESSIAERGSNLLLPFGDV